MNKPLWSAVIISIALFGFPHLSFADFAGCNCSCGVFLRPPCGEDACRRACGGGDVQQAPSARPSYDYEAERQRQETAERQRIEIEQQRMEEERQRERAAEAERQRREEAAKRRQAEFERNKQEALRSMKGIAEGELGLKGSNAGELGLKDMGGNGAKGFGLKDAPASATAAKPKKAECEWGDMGPQVVDLRCLGLDPNKSIAVDPYVVKGRERVFPAQIDPKTFENANYNKGFEALKRFDADSAAAAVQYFRQAQNERPNDPMVRNALLLAQDILKGRQKKEQDDKAQAAQLTLLSYAALMMGDSEQAKTYTAQARKLAPKDDNAKFMESLANFNLRREGSFPERKYAYRLVANSLVFIRRQDYDAAAVFLESARHAQPQDQFIDAMLSELRKYGAGRNQAGGGK
jgi:tetratricopeptide (TPR) repeat protein